MNAMNAMNAMTTRTARQTSSSSSLRLLLLGLFLGTMGCGRSYAAENASSNDDERAAGGGGRSSSRTNTTSPGSSEASDRERASEGDDTTTPTTDGSPKSPPLVAAPLTRLRGELGSTSSAFFGGSGACNYNITMTNVGVEVLLNATGTIIGVAVQNDTLERTIGVCPYPPAPATTLSFVLRTSPGRATEMDLEGSQLNQPVTRLTAKLNQTTGGEYELALTWTRADLAFPFAWDLTETIPLTVEPSCAPGETACGLNADNGRLDLLVTCAASGRSFTVTKQCANGCEMRAGGEDHRCR